MSHILETLRDRVVHRSQLWKGKLDATWTRRQLDTKLVALGERFLLLAREGRAAVPPELRDAVTEARDLEDRLQGQLDDVAALRGEVA
ncbi:MAG TPA: hypothetical protein VFK85_11460 [Anaeromyxobacteraceae bacterium]|nr:hypothetical protein [Anaeromyxobacteraceae bacterium]